MISQENKAGFRNPWFLGMLGLIVLVLSVNATFIWYATHNRSSLVDRDYKTKDRKSNNEVLAEIGAQQALAWKTSLRRNGQVVVGVPASYEIEVLDREGKPVSGSMSVEAYRPSDAGQDFTAEFTETSAGNYQGHISFPLKGYWELRILVKRGSESFRAEAGRFMVAEAR